MQNFSDVLQTKHFKIGGQIEGVGKMCVFQRETSRILEKVRDKAKVTINH